MKWIVLTVSFFVIFSCCSAGLVTAQVKDPSEFMDDKNLTQLVVKIARGFVVIVGQERSLFIDYRNGVIFNLLSKTGDCQQFDVTRNTKKDNFESGQIELFGEFKFIEEGQTRKGTDLWYSTFKVLYGHRVMMLRGVPDTSLEQFGVTFTPGGVEYVVDKNYGDVQLIIEAAQYNTSLAPLNPLIFQLDLTHLILHSCGVPVQKRYKTEVTEFFFSIEKEETLRGILKKQCVVL